MGGWIAFAVIAALGVFMIRAASARRAQPALTTSPRAEERAGLMADRFTGRVFYCNLVGEQFKNADGSSRQATIRKLAVGEEVRLVRERGNKYDVNAILATVGGKGLGYLPGSVAAFVSGWLDERQGRFVRASVRFLSNAEPSINVGLAVGFQIHPRDFPPGYLDRLEDEI